MDELSFVVQTTGFDLLHFSVTLIMLTRDTTTKTGSDNQSVLLEVVKQQTDSFWIVLLLIIYSSMHLVHCGKPVCQSEIEQAIQIRWSGYLSQIRQVKVSSHLARCIPYQLVSTSMSVIDLRPKYECTSVCWTTSVFFQI